MWDLQSGKLLRTIPDAHPLGSAVLHVMVRRGGDGKHGLINNTCNVYMQPSPQKNLTLLAVTPMASFLCYFVDHFNLQFSVLLVFSFCLHGHIDLTSTYEWDKGGFVCMLPIILCVAWGWMASGESFEYVYFSWSSMWIFSLHKWDMASKQLLLCYKILNSVINVFLWAYMIF